MNERLTGLSFARFSLRVAIVKMASSDADSEVIILKIQDFWVEG